MSKERPFRLPALAFLAAFALHLLAGGACAEVGEVLKTFTTADGLPNNWVKAISTPPGVVCVSAGDDLRGGTAVRSAGEGAFSPYAPGAPFRGKRVTSWVRFGGKDFVATEAALNVGEGGTWSSLDRFQSVQHSEEILVPAGDRLYAIAPVMYGGVLRYDGASWSVVDRGRGTGVMNNATSLAAKGAELFIGTTTNGLFHFDGAAWSVVSTDRGLPSPWVTSVAVDAGGKVWLGTIGGLGLLEGGKVRLLRVDDGLPSNKVSALAAAKGALVVGTMDRGVAIRTAEGFVAVGAARGLPDDRVTSLAVTDEGLWVGTVNGLALVSLR